MKSKTDKEALKQVKKLNKKKKETKNIKEKVGKSILDWCDIKEVTNEYILLSEGNKNTYVKGVKITPHDIFLDTPDQQARLIDLLRQAHNKLACKLYHAFVTTPCDFEDYKSRLYQFNKDCDDKTLLRMNMTDFNKVEQFESYFVELEFMIFIRGDNLKYLDKDLNDLYNEFRSAEMNPKILKKTDFLNYIDWLFENPLANSYYFSRGIFSTLNEDYRFDEATGQIIIDRKVIDEDEFEENALNTEFVDGDFSYKEIMSKYAPTCFKDTNDYMIISDRYCTCLLTMQLPRQYQLGLLCEYLNNKDVKVFMTTEKIDINISSMIKKDYNEKLDEWNRTSDPTRRNTLEQELHDTDLYLRETIADNDKTKNMIIVFMVCADSKNELYDRVKDVKSKLEADGFIVSTAKCMQEQCLRMVSPVMLEGKLPAQIRENYGQPQPSKGIAGLYPYVFETLKDKHGFLFGSEMQNGGAIIFDQFFYRNEHNKADYTRRVNGGMVICGTSGSGKTVSLDLILRWHIKMGHHVITIDPENKIFKMLRRYKGSIINYGLSDNIINTFDLRPISTDEDEDDPTYSKEKAEAEMWNTKNAIDKVIGGVTQDFETLFNEFSDEEASVLGQLIVAAYRKCGIDERRGSFRDLSSDQMPTYSTVRDICYELKTKITNTDSVEYKTLEKLLYKLSRICGEWGRFLDGHTSIKLGNQDRKLLVFGTKHLQDISVQLTTALKRIMYDYAWSLCIDNEDRSVFCLDEAHTDILVGKTAERVAQFVRRGRKYNTCIILATQEPSDFSDSSILTHGKAIFNNCAYKLIMNLNRDAAFGVSKLITINENEFNMIQNFDRGQGLFVCGNRRIPIRVFATNEELDEIGA